MVPRWWLKHSELRVVGWRRQEEPLGPVKYSTYRTKGFRQGPPRNGSPLPELIRG